MGIIINDIWQFNEMLIKFKLCLKQSNPIHIFFFGLELNVTFKVNGTPNFKKLCNLGLELLSLICSRDSWSFQTVGISIFGVYKHTEDAIINYLLVRAIQRMIPMMDITSYRTRMSIVLATRFLRTFYAIYVYVFLFWAIRHTGMQLFIYFISQKRGPRCLLGNKGYQDLHIFLTFEGSY